MSSADNQQGRPLGEPSETTRQADYKPCPSGHGLEEKRTRPSDGWAYCRACKNEKERDRRKVARRDPAKGAKMRERGASEQRARRRNPDTREAVLATDRAQHMRHREARLAAFRKRDRERIASGALYVQRYGIAADEVAEAIANRPTRCEICSRETALVFDHDATTKRFRGWLCRTCNAGLGQFGDTLDGVRAAVVYLERSLKI